MKAKTLCSFFILILLGSACSLVSAVVQPMKDPLGRDYYLYLPEKIDPARTYWLVCYVHGSGGPNAYGKPNIPGLLDFVARGDCIGVAPSFAIGFQLLKNRTDEQLIAILHQLGERYHLHTKLFVYGHFAGSQFSHRFTLRHPDLVVGCEACSSGTWATGGVYQSLNEAAKTIPIAIACGSEDRDSRGAVIARLANSNHLNPSNAPIMCRRERRYQMGLVRSEDPGWNRIEWFKKFREQLAQGNYFFKSKIFSNDMHNVPMREQDAFALEAFLLGTSGMLPQERALYDSKLAAIKQELGEGKTDLAEKDSQQLQHDAATRSRETLRTTLTSQDWHSNTAALDQCLQAGQEFVRQELSYLHKPY